jgi:AcrR family transcriptional regulator
MSEKARPGRQRSEASRLALLDTTYTLMKKRPFDQISTQEIAREAGVSTATVYRWWSSKEALMLDAFLHVKEREARLPTTGTPLERIKEHMVLIETFLGGEEGRVGARIVAAIQDDDRLRKGFIEQLYLPQSDQVVKVIQEAVVGGELPPDTDIRMLMDHLWGSCLVRILIRQERVRAADVEADFDFVIAGAWASWRRRSGTQDRHQAEPAAVSV